MPFRADGFDARHMVIGYAHGCRMVHIGRRFRGLGPGGPIGDAPFRHRGICGGLFEAVADCIRPRQRCGRRRSGGAPLRRGAWDGWSRSIWFRMSAMRSPVTVWRTFCACGVGFPIGRKAKSTDGRKTGTIRAFNMHDVVICVERGHDGVGRHSVCLGPVHAPVINGGCRLRYRPAGGRARNRTYRRNRRRRRSFRRRIPHPSSRHGRRPGNDNRLACTRPTV